MPSASQAIPKGATAHAASVSRLLNRKLNGRYQCSYLANNHIRVTTFGPSPSAIVQSLSNAAELLKQYDYAVAGDARKGDLRVTGRRK